MTIQVSGKRNENSTNMRHKMEKNTNNENNYLENNNQEDWFTLEEIPNGHLSLLGDPFIGWSDFMKKEICMPIHINLGYKENRLYLFFLRHELLEYAKKLFKKNIDDPDFLSSIDKMNKKAQKNAFEIGKKLEKINFTRLSNKELSSNYKEFTEVYKKTFYPGWVDNVLEFENEVFSKYLRKYLDNKGKNIRKNGAELFAVFSMPEKMTYGAKEEKALQSFIKTIKADKELYELFKKETDHIEKELESKYPELNKKLNEHTKEFCWYFFMYEGPEWSKKDFIDQIKQSLDKPEKDFSTNVEEKKRLTKELGIDEKHQIFLNQACEMIYNKDLRKHAIYYLCYTSQELFREIGKRLDISLYKARNMLCEEVEKGLSGDKLPDLEKREKGTIIKIYNGKYTLADEKETNNFIKNISENDEKTNQDQELKGSCAYPGKVKGKVKIVNIVADIEKVKEGDILVSHQTNPDLLPAMKLASGFITDIGGITCHASIVAREMKKPCVVGTKCSTKKLKDGDKILLDADNGYIEII